MLTWKNTKNLQLPEKGFHSVERVAFSLGKHQYADYLLLTTTRLIGLS
jgi:hypothetical protein